ncbi:MFS transporter [Actomonas aquatica]|uniref:MFS transporter n=1 Tax=Actomonas aquatica TaxID=2866162 RepID=A0ABZ1CI11_9BACT|nr:MFS transporter [Opitutus sp. WL0086]WRQ89895.1 MFS transporter [Opitutus sp. WL0086]
MAAVPLPSAIQAPTPISRVQAHYFAVYAVFGCITPYIPIYLRDVKQLCASEIGFTFATGQAAVLLMPVILTYLADRYRLVRPLLLTMFLVNIVAMTALIGAAGFWATLIWVSLNRMVTQPQVALADGIYFSLQSDPAQPRAPYANVRVWGTVGYIAPSLVIYGSYYLRDYCAGGLVWMPYVAGGFAIFGVLNALRMPRRYHLPATVKAPPKVPTLAAARVLLRPKLLVFLLGVGFVISSNMAFYGFYPLYLTTQIGIDERWVGLISSLGVAVEILYILNMERLRRRIGFGGLLLLGGIASLFRLACLAYLPTPFFSIVFQLVHGLTVIGYMIVPVMYLNAHAGEGYRNSIQGVYVMVIQGAFSIAGNIVSGQLAEIGLLTLYRYALLCCLLGLALVALSFRLKDRPKPLT